MALNIEQKKAVVAEVADAANKALAAVAAEYRGLTVEEMTDLRAKARETGVYLKVAKNTLVRRAVEGTEYECMQESLTGPLLLAFSMEDPGAAARLVKEFSKDHDELITKLVVVGGQLYDASELERLSSLPTYDQAIAILMGVMKAPIEKFVRTLAEPHAKLVRTVAAVRDAKEAA
ncbi:MAG: 50S ribosomal protein L10 [Xanthomonadales bacterium]|nr:50S ribosomal protein L10 [Gammaproteobacteria bacterium]NNJ80036.1 50S ribosomal protein L10 [Xanthomonadales bacterium]NNL05581.1 50S ribosomal protein L10 [Xanthomonadales bacterium]